MLGRVHAMDCAEGLKLLADSSVDFVFADLPYGRTQNDWDVPLALPDLWAQLKRVCKPTAALVFTAMQPFTSHLVMSNQAWFRYEVIWRKNKPRGFLNAKKQPLRVHENVCVFYKRRPKYRPQMTSGHEPVHTYTKHRPDGTNYGRTRVGAQGGGSTDRYPVSVLDIPVLNESDPRRISRTQKPVELPEWFILTYTDPDDVVLDPTAGSGSTLVAAKLHGRRYVGFEKDKNTAAAANTWLLGGTA